MLLVRCCQGESSTSAHLECCQSFNSPGGFSLLWKQTKLCHRKEHNCFVPALFEFKLICCLAPCSAQQYLAFQAHFQTIGLILFRLDYIYPSDCELCVVYLFECYLTPTAGLDFVRQQDSDSKSHTHTVKYSDGVHSLCTVFYMKTRRIPDSLNATQT